jgi:hypothetical protein
MHTVLMTDLQGLLDLIPTVVPRSSSYQLAQTKLLVYLYDISVVTKEREG